MVAEAQRTVGGSRVLARRRIGGAAAARRRHRPSWATGLLLTLAALGVVVAVSLAVAALQNPSDDVRRLTAPAGPVHHA